MTMPEYDEECDCDLCKTIRNERNRLNSKRVQEEIQNVFKDKKKFSTGTEFQEDYFR